MGEILTGWVAGSRVTTAEVAAGSSVAVQLTADRDTREEDAAAMVRIAGDAATGTSSEEAEVAARPMRPWRSILRMP